MSTAVPRLIGKPAVSMVDTAGQLVLRSCRHPEQTANTSHFLSGVSISFKKKKQPHLSSVDLAHLVLSLWWRGPASHAH